jgi:hypothetical protein
MLRPNFLATIAMSIPAFAVAGALSRYSLRTVETRWQVAAFAGFAAVVEVIARSSGPKSASIVRGILNAAAAAIMIVLVKFHLEPAARKHDSAIVRDVGKTLVRAAGGGDASLSKRD